MSKERYYYRGVMDKNECFYRTEKVPESIKTKDANQEYFDTPELCQKFCAASNRLTLARLEMEYALRLRSSYERILNGESS